MWSCWRQLKRNKGYAFAGILICASLAFVAYTRARNNASNLLTLRKYEEPRVMEITKAYQTSRPLRRSTISLEEQYMQSETARISNRLAAAMNRCEEYSKYANSTDIKLQGYAWIYQPKNLAYCVTPKVGCTFWKRIFRFLAKDYVDQNVSRPSDIDRMRVHYGRLKNITQRPLSNPIVRTLLSQSHMNAFMFARDPYSRLWSGYVDKYLLPDFWRSTGPVIVSRFRRNATNIERSCGNDVSFREFIMNVIDHLYGGRGLNEHFNPMFSLCSPCHMRFEVLGKLETFQKDAEYIFNKFGLKDLSEKVSYSVRVDEEINMLVKYNFDLEKSIKKICYNRTVVAQRLWKAFQINGYISKDNPFPSVFMKEIINSTNIAELFQEKVLETIGKQTVDKTKLKQQKRDFLAQAYNEIPLVERAMIPRLYQQDFELFKYDKYPRDIFPLTTL